MAKTLKETAITTANARRKLPAGVHWKGVDPDVHLGYRKGKRGGVWLVRWRSGQGYRQGPVGTADDAIKVGTLDYNNAVKKAREVVSTARLETKARADGPLITVRSASETYVKARNERQSKRAGREIRSDAAHRFGRHVIGQKARGKQPEVSAAPLANVALHVLSESDLHEWRENLPNTLKESTKRRAVNDLRAALNDAYSANRKRLPATLPETIRQGLKSPLVDEDEAEPAARENQILSDAQVGALLAASREIDEDKKWDGDLFPLVLTLAATGARFSQISRMRIVDFQRAERRLMVPTSRKGRGAKSRSIPVPVGRDVINALIPLTVDRQRTALLFERWHHAQIKGGIGWKRGDRGGWKTASELTRAWEEIRTKAKLPKVIPYSLRHTSIVRGIRANLPIRLVAALHDTSVQMIERHYARWIADGLEDLAAKAIVPLVPDNEGRIVKFRKEV